MLCAKCNEFDCGCSTSPDPVRYLVVLHSPHKVGLRGYTSESGTGKGREG